MAREHEEHKYYKYKGGNRAPSLLLLQPYVAGCDSILVIALHGMERWSWTRAEEEGGSDPLMGHMTLNL